MAPQAIHRSGVRVRVGSPRQVELFSRVAWLRPAERHRLAEPPRRGSPARVVPLAQAVQPYRAEPLVSVGPLWLVAAQVSQSRAAVHRAVALLVQQGNRCRISLEPRGRPHAVGMAYSTPTPANSATMAAIRRAATPTVGLLVAVMVSSTLRLVRSVMAQRPSARALRRATFPCAVMVSWTQAAAKSVRSGWVVAATASRIARTNWAA